MIFQIIGWIFFGLIVGLIERLLVPGADTMGWIWTILLGVAGSFLGGFIGQKLFSGGSDEKFNAGGFVMSIVGAIVLLLIYRMLT